MKRKIKLLYISAVISAISLSLIIFTGAAKSAAAEECFADEPIQSSILYEERQKLIPCGTPFGIKMLTNGVVVTDFGAVDSVSGISPAEASGIKKGDVIISVNESQITDSASLSSAVQDSGGICTIEVMRGNKTLTVMAKPAFSESDGQYKLGLWTRDSCAGIGTMTFYDCNKKVFGGLGHSVSDISTGMTLPLLEGEITSVTITDVLKGRNGMPGELCGAFISDKDTGTVKINSDYGVFGYSDVSPVMNSPMEIGYSSEIKKGKATIYTTIEGMNPSEYEIEIVKIDSGSTSASRNMTIRITDPKLLDRTGGIVQGMSGSPIIQDGRIIGAVTHVLINDSTMGYGIFIENMLNASKPLE